jgi:ketosteroid isomerase-like protein
LIELSQTIRINDGTVPELSVDDVWAGLVEKAENPLPYVEAITQCEVVERFDGGLIRDIVHGGPVREVVTFYPQRRVHFVRIHGSVRGTIDNEIVLDDGEHVLRFTFRLLIDGLVEGSPEEAEIGERMQHDYLDAVRTTLRAVRERIASGPSFTSPQSPGESANGPEGLPTGPPSAGEIFALIDTRDADALRPFFSDRAQFRFGNMPPMVGRDDIIAGVRRFYDSVASMQHTVINEWHRGDTVITEASVTYGRHDGRLVTIRVSSIWTVDSAGKIDNYRVFFDVTPLYA